MKGLIEIMNTKQGIKFDEQGICKCSEQWNNNVGIIQVFVSQDGKTVVNKNEYTTIMSLSSYSIANYSELIAM